jgi:hypothetical protein
VGEFFRRGFLAIETPLIAEAEVEWCRGALMRVLEEGAGRSEGRNLDLAAREGVNNAPLPSVLQPSLYARELRRLSYRKTALAVARQLLGPQAAFAGDHTIYKPSFIGGPTPWHQDEAFREPEFDYEEISIWIAMTNTTVENGAMAYIPESHLAGVLPHRLHGGAKNANTIECCAGFDPNSAEVKPIPAGAMIIHHGRTVHGAAANLSATPRLGYILQYSTPPTLRKSPREFPWLANLRSSNMQQRKRTLLLGGAFSEFLRVIRSDRYSHRHLMSFFIRRRLSKVRKLFGR